ncbi:MAG: succinate dehydrogenase, hydrophobic membrane anchor protein [Nevskiaceae bacterium]|nr:MAG: succinate dehydrogenase, hydrophobic membrane anchor protein [Nevskiaceae bacterium]TBR73998.1 MAG: succinate dehydrogenase, hydrophobic membrane anchor protein [Nevskiaceae bacterium]
MLLRSPLGQARGLGSAKEGVQHWWMQRITAVALLPLSLWFVFSVATHQLVPHDAIVAWLHNPLVAAVLVFYFAVLFYHSALGVQVVVEDYVGGQFKKLATLMLFKLAHGLVAVIAIIAVLKVAFGGM